MNIWQQCDGTQHIKPLACKAWRVVEGQYTSSTRKLVDSLAEQAILEDLLEENAKPPMPEMDCTQSLHYLLTSPFRYKTCGSRFGHQHEIALWYGSLELKTCFAEIAFYRFAFYAATVGQLKKNTAVKHTAYQASVRSQRSVALDAVPFTQYRQQLSAPDSYADTQPLGTAMRAAGIEVFSYASARQKGGHNIGVFTPAVFEPQQKIDASFQQWLSYTDDDKVEFVRDAGFFAQQALTFNRPCIAVVIP